jgi:hypothetical protein
MKEEIEDLLKQYKEGRASILSLIDDWKLNDAQPMIEKLGIKLACYRTFIKELEDILKLNVQ